MIKLSPNQVFDLAYNKAAEFCIAQNGRWNHVISEDFIKAYLAQAVKMQYVAQSNPHPVNQAYRAALQLFQNLLEKGCKISMNGQHVAEEFSALFEGETFKTNPNAKIK
jgi:hypothetical protein